ncbi:MAG: nucleotidyltransferase family protein [Clostridia bacterium]|nr:nucleotidyltransferase family protein [Clostridia bacterium]
MKICAIICEFNPFHNGHKYLLEQAEKLSGCDGVLCIMSGSFTQRGDMCILDKFTRAKHAVLGSADCVIELPVCFSVAPAEIFASGAIKLLSAIPEVTTLAFGCKNANADGFLNAANLLLSESEKFKTVLNKKLAEGESYIKSYTAAFIACGGDKEILSNPNNILGLEYTKAIMRNRADIKILPIQRIGAGYNDGEIKENFSSATAIRQNLNSPKVKENVPDFVAQDLQINYNLHDFELLLRHSLFLADESNLKRIYGCGEGLENKLEQLATLPLSEIISNATGKRYSSSRIMRILTCNALGLYSDDCRKFLDSGLYIKPLAVKADRKDEMLSALGKSNYPVIIKQRDTAKLNGEAKKCFNLDLNATAIRSLICGKSENDFMLLTI